MTKSVDKDTRELEKLLEKTAQLNEKAQKDYDTKAEKLRNR